MSKTPFRTRLNRIRRMDNQRIMCSRSLRSWRDAARRREDTLPIVDFERFANFIIISCIFCLDILILRRQWRKCPLYMSRPAINLCIYFLSSHNSSHMDIAF